MKMTIGSKSSKII